MKKNKLIIFVILALLFLPLTNIFAHPAWGIVVDSRKQIYFTDLITVYKIDSPGKLSIFRAGVSGRHVHDLSIDSQDNIYGLDNAYNPQKQTYPRAIWKMSPNREFSYLVPMTDNLPLGMSIWRDFDGNTYSVEPYNNEKKESKIIKRAPDGKMSLFAGGKYGYRDGQKDKAEFKVITDMAFGKDGAIYLTDEDKVRKIDKFGTVSTIYRTEAQNKNPKNPEPFSRLFGLDVDKQNNVFAADFDNSRVLKINSAGNVSTIFNSEKDWTPIGVAASDDEIYVLEVRPYSSAIHTGNRVLKISADGKATVIADLEKNAKSAEKGDSNSNENQAAQLQTTFQNNAKPETSGTSGFVVYTLVTLVLIGLTAFVFLRKKRI